METLLASRTPRVASTERCGPNCSNELKASLCFYHFWRRLSIYGMTDDQGIQSYHGGLFGRQVTIGASKGPHDTVVMMESEEIFRHYVNENSGILLPQHLWLIKS